MSYEAAMSRAWESIAGLKPPKILSVRFLADEYSVDFDNKRIISLACNVPAKEFVAILILHYLLHKLKGSVQASGEWLNFRELSGVEGYAAAFRQRVIEPIIRKYGSNPKGLLTALERLPGEKSEGADAAIILDVFEDVRALIKLWRQDEEFQADANMFFDGNITRIFSTEDIVVLAGIIASQL